MSAPISLLILALALVVLVILVIAYVAIYLVDMIGLPSPMNWIARAIVALIALLYLLNHAGMI